ncbi:MAG: cytochrome c family protein [Caulobacter sp.]|nr:cytochrome c family protein [Caulobacter sp.]
MSDLTFNKIAGGLLAAGLVIFGLRELTTTLFEQEPPEKPGYAVAVAEAGGEGGAVAEVAPDWGTVIPAANIEVGKAISAKCTSCHTFDQGGANGTGPSLFGVVGRKPGSHGGFAYSPGMTGFAGAHAAWTFEELDAFLKAPQKYVDGTKMGFIGLKKQEDRIAMIAYLQSLGSSLPVPAPRPAEAAVAAPAEGAAPAAAPAPAAAQ